METDLSLDRLELHRQLWQRKPVLEAVYSVWFRLLLEAVAPARRVLEVGAGPGFLADYARRAAPETAWTATDLLPAPWNNVAADAHRLPFGEATFDAVVGLDFIHHLSGPRQFLLEAARVLRAGGRLAVVEPWVTPLSYPVYRWLHEEGCRLDLDPWQPFGSRGPADKDAFEGDAAVLWRLVRTSAPAVWFELGLGPPRVRPLSGFAYLLSLGFRPASLLPRRLAGWVTRLDRGAACLAPWLGLRALAVWEKQRVLPADMRRSAAVTSA